jgi:hypothetical protein
MIIEMQSCTESMLHYNSDDGDHDNDDVIIYTNSKEHDR